VKTTTDSTKRPSNEDEIFEHAQAELFGLAYGMVGSAVDAADIVADAYLRWRSARRDDVRDPRACLFTVVARLSIDVLAGARARGEVCVGQFLPGPLLVDEVGLAEASELSESLSLAFFALPEEVSPAEQAADGRLRGVRVVANPDQLAALNRTLARAGEGSTL
jgi:RNA polymerase sigma-70 factor (ECF subfamily)